MVILYNAITYTNSKNRQCVDECSMCKKQTNCNKNICADGSERPVQHSN